MPNRDPSKPLKGKAEAFSFARSCGYNVREAVLRAGSTPESGVGSKWEYRPDVRARIAWWRSFKQTDEILAEKRALIERELQRVGTANIADFISLTEPSEGKASLPVLDLTRIHALPEAQRRDALAAVKTIRYTDNGPTFELHGKLEALNQLRDMHGFKAMTKTALVDPRDPSGNTPGELTVRFVSAKQG